jgi:hypothetical protein
MRGIGRSSIGKFAIVRSTIVISSGFVFASAMTVLLPRQASAQFNIDGIIRGAIQQGGYGYRGPVQHYSSHPSSSSHSDSDDDSASDNKNGKGVKSTNDSDTGGGSSNGAGSSGSKGSGSSTSQSASTGRPSGGSGGGSSANPPKTSDDMPSFSPSR